MQSYADREMAQRLHTLRHSPYVSSSGMPLNLPDNEVATLSAEEFADYASTHYACSRTWPAPATMPQLRYMLHLEREAYQIYANCSHTMPDGTVIPCQSVGERLTAALTGIPVEPLTPPDLWTNRQQESFLRTLQEDEEFREALLGVLAG